MENNGSSQAEWELSKENIQPLKSGRKAAKLANISQPKDLKLLNEERQEFESEIRLYNGPDPLDPWYRYISWVEQEYPKGGKEGNIPTLIESCIRRFKEDKTVHNDARFVEIWLKYAAISSKPLEVFDFMYNNGLCTQKAETYEAWAWYLETSGAFKKAEGVFTKGINAMTSADCRDRLTLKQKQFQARVIRRLNGEEIPEEETEEEKRSALGQLRGHGKHAKVSSVRVGHAKLGGPGVMPMGGAVSKQPLRPSNHQAGFKIYSDENAVSGVTGPGSASGRQQIPSKIDSKENEMAAGPWTKAKIVKSSHNVPLDSISQYSKPAFTVYQEPDIAQPNKTPQRKIMPAENNVLSTKKDQKWEVHCPLALFETPDPTKKPMYCKDKVYQGATEFSFEELRALRWKEKNKQQQEIEMIEKRKAELVEMERKLLEQHEAMERKMAEWQRMMSGGSTVIAPGVMVTRPSVDSVSSISDVPQLSRQTSSVGSVSDVPQLSRQPSSVSNVSDVPQLSRQPSLDTTANLIAANPLGGGNTSRNKSIATPSPHGNKHPSLTQPSPTVNTKEAMAAMQALWYKPSGEEDQDPQPLQESGNSASVPFQIYSDSRDSETDSGKAGPGFEIFCDSHSNTGPAVAAPTPAPFTIFCDENAGQVTKLPTVSRRARSEMINRSDDKENSPQSTDDEDRENAPPSGYTQPRPGLRTKTGILTESENVDFIPLDVQEKMLDEDELRQGHDEYPVFKSPKSKLKTVNKLPVPKPFAGNQTIMLPNEDDFEKMAKMCSTPFNGKPSFEMEQDENTCAVNILYKHPALDDLNETDNNMGPPAAAAGQEDQTNIGAAQRLDTIVETSREYYRSSSSSSGGDTLHHATNRSHWGNTGHSQLHLAHSNTGVSLARTPGHHLGVTTGSSVSGYLGDKSNNITKSGVKDNKRELLASPQVPPSFEKRMKIIEDNDEEDIVDDGMFSDMMAELKNNIVKKEMENSMQASFLDDARERVAEPLPKLGAPSLDLTGAANLDVTGAPRLNFTGAQRMDVTGAPRLDITGAQIFGAPRLDATGVPRLDVTGAPRLDVTGAPRLDVTGAPRLDITGAPRLDITGARRLDMTGAPSLDITAAAPSLDMSTDNDDHGIAAQTANLSLDGSLDPFHPNTHTTLLAALKTPVSSLHGYIAAPNKSVPNIRVKGTVTLGDDVFYVSSCKGEGGYAKVYAANRQDNDLDCTISGIDAVLKVQKPANDWEFYICTQVQRRVPDNLKSVFMSIPRNYVFNDGGVFVSYHQKFGTLLDIINIVKTSQVGKMCIEPMAIYFTIELLKIVEAIHAAGIIHADLKPDNLLLQTIPTLPSVANSAEELFEEQQMSLQLIDFGRSIDMSLLPPGTSFTQVVDTDGITCTEMREGRPWREHIDYFGIAAVAYCLLFQHYIEVVKIDERWEVKGTYRRWWQQDLWRSFFSDMINIQGVNKDQLPSLSEWRLKFQQIFYERDMSKHLKRLTSDVMQAMMS